MLRLVIANRDVELYENAPVNLTFQYNDIEKINNPLGSYSQAFRVPLTRYNRTIFGDLDQQSLVGGLDLRSRLDASLWSHTMPIMTGYVQVKGVYIMKEEFCDVELVFFSGAQDLKGELEGKMLADLDLSSHEYNIDYATIAANWTEPLEAYPGDVKFGVVDRGQNWTYETFGTEDNPIRLPEMTPFIRAKLVLDAIMDEAGFTYDSTFFDSDEFTEDMFLMLANGSTTTKGEDDFDEDMRATLPSNQNVTGGQSLVTIGLEVTGTGCYDEGPNFQSVNNWYVAPISGLYQINCTFSVEYYTAGTPGASISILKNSGGSITGLVGYNATEIRAYNLTFPVVETTLAAGDRVYISVTNAGSADFRVMGSDNFSVGNRTSLEVVLQAPLGDYDFNISRNMPKMSQVDFVLGLQRMFNLLFIPDALRPNHLSIETYADYFGSAQQKDWTNKVDYGKDVHIKPTTDLQSNEYQWTYKNGNDFLNKAIQESLDRVYGAYKVEETGNEFATGEKKIETTFAPFTLSLVPGTATPAVRLLSDKGEAVKNPLPRLAYFVGFSESWGGFHYMDEDGTTSFQGSFPVFSNYFGLGDSITTNDLNYGMEQNFYPVAVNPFNTLYFRFWAQYVAELYSEDARIMTCSMRLTQGDLADWSFQDSIYIKDTFYRIISLSYDASEPSIANVVLQRKLDDITVCEFTPTGTAGRVVLFGQSYGNQKCCELYGYSWQLVKGNYRCVTPNQTISV